MHVDGLSVSLGNVKAILVKAEASKGCWKDDSLTEVA